MENTKFLAAAKYLGVKAAAGMETRVFVPELADKEINSPGEPGVAYHLALGFTRSEVPAECQAFANELRQKAAQRTRTVVEKVNPHVGAAALDFDTDAVSLTPRGNVTERHVCEAYRVKAEKQFPQKEARAAFWKDILGLDSDTALAMMDDPVKLEASIRSKLMKKGGPGYMKPEPSSFPALKAMNDFAIACGAIPTVAWLNGLSAGEADCDALLDMHAKYGMEMLNIVPDRNWNVPDPEKSARLIAELNKIVEACRKRNIPLVAGTEMNAPGLKIVDDFDHPALAPILGDFVNGAAILAAHTMLEPSGMGFCSPWSKAKFADKAARNNWFANFGKLVSPSVFAGAGKNAAEWVEEKFELIANGEKF